MRDVRRLIVAGPWPVHMAFYVVFLVVISWPLALRTAGPPYPVLPGIAIGVVLSFVQRRQDRRETGWTPAEQFDVIRRAHEGDLPTDPADRSRLRLILARYAKEARPLPWIELVGFTAFAAAVLASRDTFRGWSEWPVAAFYVLVAVTLFVLIRRRNARRRALLAALDGVSDAAGG